jgi:hypothetical protein
MSFSRLKSVLVAFSILFLGCLGTTAKLVFHDSFDRSDGSQTEDAIGNEWTTNSAWRADGEKQAFLNDGMLTITRLENANHAVSVKHNFALSDCTVSVKFKLGEKDQLGVNFNDPELKTSHAGHVCSVRVTTNKLSVADQMNGSMNLVLREKRQAGYTSKELKQAIAKTENQGAIDLQPDRWHELQFEMRGETVRVLINSVFQLEHHSPGFGYPTKRNIAFSVPKNVTIDDFQVWDEADTR